jgi:hypothetical protein
MTYLDTGNVGYRIEGAGTSVERYAEVSSALLAILSKAGKGNQQADGSGQQRFHDQGV